jgi:hypothetical protein
MNCETPRPCDVVFTIAPGSSKWVWLEWPKRELGAATITAATWTVPAGFTEAASSISGLRTGLRLTAPEGDARGWLELTITTSATETLYKRVGVEVSKSGH